jgi:hypothetical protein
MLSKPAITQEIHETLTAGGYVAPRTAADKRTLSVRRLYASIQHKGTHLAEITRQEFDAIVAAWGCVWTDHGWKLPPSAL